jgi:2-polyprenyl-6-methoxyphenol hydroxylase-like FAD-dependent oxidoreductase
MRLEFSGKEPVLADWVIAADGIRSSVVASVLPDAPPPRPMGVRLILGLTSDKTGMNGLNLNHSLLKERGFYSLSSGHRLFVMPYSAASPLHPTTETRYMWQLSFTEDADQASSASGMSPLDLQRGALERCREWHSPVEDLIRSTPLDAIWSTHLCDRDPKLLQDLLLQKIAKQQGSASDPSYFDRVILIGDALHAMSCFKGQGANQALLDGTVVGKWFAMALSGACKSPLATLRGCMREMVQRTAPIVAASRVAAMHWHSSAALSEAHTLAGVSQDRVDELLGRLKERNIVVDSVADLDTAIRIELKAIGIAKQDETGDAKPVSTQWVEAVVYATEAGDLRRLRELSWSSSHSCWLQRITSNEGNTCLHIAVENGHLEIVNWLVTQAGFDPRARNTTGRTPKEMAKDMVVGELMEQLQLHSTFNST